MPPEFSAFGIALSVHDLRLLRIFQALPMDILHVPTRIVITPADPRSIVLEKLSGMREQPIIISMPTTVRPQQRYVSLSETPYILWPLGLSLWVDNVNRHLSQASFRTRAELRAQILALRHQLPFFSRARSTASAQSSRPPPDFSREEQEKEGERRLAECWFPRAERFRQRTRQSASAEFSHRTRAGEIRAR